MLDGAKNLLKRVFIERLLRADAARRKTLGDAFNGLPPALWGYEIDREGRLTVEGISVISLAERFGSPLYVVNSRWLRKSHDDFLMPFRSVYSNASLATSYKTNPLPSVLRTLHDLGTYAEVISDFELWLALRLGLPGDKIVVNGPGKDRGFIARAVASAVKIINIDGLGEIAAIESESSRLGRPQPVGVRVVTSIGWSSQFGLSIATGEALDAFARIAASKWLRPIGIHLHIGTGLKDVDAYVSAVTEVLRFSEALRARLGITLEVFDLGGGFGVPTVRATDPWDDRMISLGYPAREAFPPDCPTAADYAARIAPLFRTRSAFQPEIIFEPGRAITSGAQSLVLRVIAVKERADVRQLIMDGGKNITMPLGWETHKIFPLTQTNGENLVKTEVFGPLCHPGDVIARHLKLPRLEVGDGLAIMDAGAYFVPNQMNFSNPRPAALMIQAGEPRIVRQRETYEDIVKLDALP